MPDLPASEPVTGIIDADGNPCDCMGHPIPRPLHGIKGIVASDTVSAEVYAKMQTTITNLRTEIARLTAERADLRMKLDRLNKE